MLPDAGDIFWVALDPTSGTEQAGRRPALVLSDARFHAVSSRVIVCPITSRVRHWPTSVLLPPGMATEGEVLVDQIRALDRAARLIRRIETAPPAVLDEVQARLAPLLGLVAPVRRGR